MNRLPFHCSYTYSKITLTILISCLLFCNCNSGGQKNTPADTATTKTLPVTPNVSKVVFIDTTIGSKHFTVSFLPVSDNKTTDHFFLYVGVNGCYDSVRATYYGWNDTKMDNKMFIAAGSTLVRATNILLDDSLVIISLKFNVAGVQLLFAKLGSNCIKFQNRHLESDAPFIIFPKDHVIGIPVIRGAGYGEVYLDKYDNKDTLYEYTIINPHYSEEYQYNDNVISIIRKAIDRRQP